MAFYNHFFGFPNFYWHPYYQNTNLHKSQTYLNNNPNNSCNCNKKTSSDSFNEPEEVKNSSNYNSIFNFLGLNLQTDDVLILTLLFFLYKEDCDDVYLYIALFLLLLS